LVQSIANAVEAGRTYHSVSWQKRPLHLITKHGPSTLHPPTTTGQMVNSVCWERGERGAATCKDSLKSPRLTTDGKVGDLIRGGGNNSTHPIKKARRWIGDGSPATAVAATHLMMKQKPPWGGGRDL